MGYFSNGSEGMDYHSEYCENCVHWNEVYGCPVWTAHELWNYDECNKKDSIMHKMIPRTDDGWNRQCFTYASKTMKP